MPFCSCTVMRSLDDTIHDRIAEMHIRIRHIEFCAKNHAAFYGLRSIHLLKQSKVFFDWAITIWASSTWRGRSTLLLCNFFSSLFIYICIALLDHPDSKIPKLLKVVRSIVDIAPLETEPLDVLKNILYIFIVFLARVSVIKTKIANTIIFLCNTKVHADSFGMADMQITIRLWRKTSLDSSSVFAFFEVFLN